jgi:hypothetical protein
MVMLKDWMGLVVPAIIAVYCSVVVVGSQAYAVSVEVLLPSTRVISLDPVSVDEKLVGAVPSTRATWHSFARELTSDLAADALARFAWPRKAGSAIAERMPTIITTIKSSIKVKPLDSFRWD